MLAQLIINPDLQTRVDYINQILSKHQLHNLHPDVLCFNEDKIGIETAKKIKEHFSYKPYQAQGKAVVAENADKITVEAQNALLKTIEELPKHALFLVGASSENTFLPTILSRCEIVRIMNNESGIKNEDIVQDIAKLGLVPVEKRFEYIEKLKDKSSFLNALVSYFHQNLASYLTSAPPRSGKYSWGAPPRSGKCPWGGNTKAVEFIKDVLEAEKWAKANVNIRGILEYLMLRLPN